MKIDEVTPNIGKVYLDMDGVLCYLDKAVSAYNNISITTFDDAGWDNKYWDHVLATADIKKFFVNLEWQPKGKELVNWVREHKLPVEILTRPVKQPLSKQCIEGKKIWLSNHGLGDIPAVFEAEKEKYATSDSKVNILIDDHSGNIEKWNEAGGIGIHYRSARFQSVIEKLKSLYGIE